MAIHHATLKAAAAQGIDLTQAGLSVRAFCPRLGCELFHDGKARVALDQMVDLIWLRDSLDAEGLTYEVVPEGDASDHDCATLTLKVGSWDANGHPSEVRAAFRDRAAAGSTVPMESEEERLAILAEQRGVDVSDIEDEEAAEVEEDDEKLSGSVVSEKYRAIYAEAGHPTHCGDDMAVWFDTHCANKAGTDLSLFETICGLNGVDLAKYDRTRPGWQGRLRMTGRNMLARRVYLADGVMRLPETMGGEKRFGADWLTSRKFAKPKEVKVAEPTSTTPAEPETPAPAPSELQTGRVEGGEHIKQSAPKRDRTRKGRGK